LTTEPANRQLRIGKVLISALKTDKAT